MAQPAGFPAPIDALLAVATCLGDFTIMNEAADAALEPRIFIGDEGVGGVIDCCSGGGSPIMRIESGGEIPTDGPVSLGKHGCISLTMAIKVTFLTCFKTISKSGVVITDPAELDYTRVIQDSRWQAIETLRCCRPASIAFVSSIPVNTDGKCSGWTIDLQAAMSICGPCPATPAS